MSASRRLVIVGLPASVGLAGCGAVVRSAVDAAVAPAAGSDVVTGHDTLRRARRLVVAGFMVEYVTEFRRAGEGTMATVMFTDAPTNASITTTGVDPATLPGLTNRLYDGFVADAQAGGFEMVAHESLVAQPGFAAFATMGSPSPASQDGRAGKGIFVSARGLPIFYIPEQGFVPQFTSFGANKADQDEFLPRMSQFTAGYSSIAPLQAAQALATALDATAVMVRVTIAGGALAGNRSFWTGDSVRTGAGLSVVPFVTRLAFLDGSGGRARVALGSPVVTADIGLLSDVTSTGSKAMDAAGNAILMTARVATALVGGVGMGGGGSRERNYEYKVDPAKFDGAVLGAWQQANRRLLTLAKAG